MLERKSLFSPVDLGAAHGHLALLLDPSGVAQRQRSLGRQHREDLEVLRGDRPRPGAAHDEDTLRAVADQDRRGGDRRETSDTKALRRMVAGLLRVDHDVSSLPERLRADPLRERLEASGEVLRDALGQHRRVVVLTAAHVDSRGVESERHDRVDDALKHAAWVGRRHVACGCGHGGDDRPASLGLEPSLAMRGHALLHVARQVIGQEAERAEHDERQRFPVREGEDDRVAPQGEDEEGDLCSRREQDGEEDDHDRVQKQQARTRTACGPAGDRDQQDVEARPAVEDPHPPDRSEQPAPGKERRERGGDGAQHEQGCERAEVCVATARQADRGRRGEGREQRRAHADAKRPRPEWGRHLLGLHAPALRRPDRRLRCHGFLSNRHLPVMT